MLFRSEREIKFESGRRAGANISVIEGGCALRPGDSVAMITDGIVKNWKHDQTGPAAELSKVLTDAQGDDSAALQEALDKNIKGRSKRARKLRAEDDLTVVIVKLTPGGEGDE